MPLDRISIRGARQHNLKNIHLDIPRDRLVVITGVSGSGKSSLAFDTIYAEGQRRYVESLSAYARQFLQMMEKPDVDSIDGLSPAISIDQKTTSRNPRSTVGTVTEIYDYLRLLYARIGHPHCPVCGRPIAGQSLEAIVDQVLRLPEGTRFTVNAPVVRDRKGEYKDVFEEAPELDKKFKHTIEVVVDRLVMKPDLRTRLAQSIETAAQLAEGLVAIDVVDGEAMLFSENFACPEHGVSLPELEPRIFSFNSPHGACPRCTGLGAQQEIDPDLLVPDPSLSIGEGALVPWTLGNSSFYESVIHAIEFLDELGLTPTEELIGHRIVKEIRERLTFLDNVGVGYLQLDRASASLSGGEAQRLRLATPIGSQLLGVLYILDEPSIGLHQRDNNKLIQTLERLRDLGNTVLVVEHDEQMMREADWLVDMGPGAGEHGGHLVAGRGPEEIMSNPP